MTKYKLILLFSFFVIITGCRKDIDGLDGNSEVITPIDVTYKTIANLNGLVSDLSGAPIIDANIELNGEVAMTDKYGYFRFTEKEIDNNGSLLTISKSGHISSYKFVYPTTPGGYSHIRVSLPSKDLTGSFNASNGGAIETHGGAKVEFDANVIMDANNSPYTGGVNVYAYWYNPNNDDISLIMPGDLRGTDKEGNVVQLATFGMLSVELETPEGQPLNIKAGHTAELTFPLETLTDSAPDEIPLWYLDEHSGIWIEEGKAIKVGNSYVGSVSHFSFWNCDAPFPLVNINGLIKDSDGNLISNTSICLQVQEQDSWWGIGYGWTDQFGEYSGKIPKNKVIMLTIKDQCNNVIHEEEIGPFDIDIIMDPLIIDFPGIITINGKVTDCDGNLINDGYVAFEMDNANFPFYIVSEVDENGSFSYIGDICESLSGTVQAFDYATASYSEEVEFEIVTGQEADLGILSLCESADEHITYSTVYGGIFEDVIDLSIIDGKAIITGSNSANTWSTTTIEINNIAVGNNIADNYLFNSSSLYAYCQEDCNSLNIEVALLGSSIGDYVEGSISGAITQDSLGQGEPIDINGKFRAQIDYIGAGGSISGMVWIDENSDGIRQETETPYQDVWIGTNNLFSLSDDNGMYSLTGLKPGEYDLWIESPLPLTLANQGNDDTIDSDFDDIRVKLNIMAGEKIENFDVGLVLEAPILNCFIDLELFCKTTGEGSFIVNADGGTPPYTFTFNDSIFESQHFFFTDFEVGDMYTVKVTDVNGETCSITNEVVSIDESIVQVFAWNDVDENGVFNANIDGLIPGTLAELIDLNDNVYESIEFGNTNQSITYSSINEGSYYVRITPPEGFKIGNLPNSGNTGSLNANIDKDAEPAITGSSAIFEVIGCTEYYEFGVAIVPE